MNVLCLLIGVAVVTAVIVIVKRKKHSASKPAEAEQTSVTVITEEKPAETAVYWYKDGVKKWGVVRMAYGIQMFDANGGLIFDLANATTYVLGSGSTGTSNGSLSDSNIVAGSTWVAITGAGAVNPQVPKFTISNGAISWSFPQLPSYAYQAVLTNVNFIYGGF